MNKKTPGARRVNYIFQGKARYAMYRPFHCHSSISVERAIAKLVGVEFGAFQLLAEHDGHFKASFKDPTSGRYSSSEDVCIPELVT